MRWFWILAPLALTACSEDTPQFGGTSAPGASDTTDSDPIIPEEGDWTLWSTEAISDTCGLRPDEPSDEELTEHFYLGDPIETGFEIRKLDLELGWIEVQCVLDGIGFDCGPWDYVYEVPAVDAILTTSWTVRGDVVNPTELGGINGTSVACAGEDCELVADLYELEFPCGFSDYFAATRDLEDTGG